MSGLRGRRLRVAQVAPLAESVPPKLYGGTERVVSWLTEELVSLGHDVTLFATGDSVTNAQLVPVAPRALRLSRPSPDPAIATAALLEAVADAARRFDVIQFASGLGAPSTPAVPAGTVSHHPAWPP